MRIAFVVCCLESGRDGVGDYTRRLAAECIRQGHSSAIVALNDGYVSQASFGSQEVDGTSLSVLRLPRVMPWDERVAIGRKWMEDIDPQWVSLQFVPFGFHPKGLLFGIFGHLVKIVGSRPLHCMFHEIWVLWKFPLSIRKRLLGQCQKLSLRSFRKKLKPKACATQLPLYQAELKKIGVAANLLPLHGNIPIVPSEAADQWLAERCGKSTSKRRVKAGFFGAILTTINLPLVSARISELTVNGDEVLLLSAGKIDGVGVDLWRAMEEKMGKSATFIKLGELNEREASLYFSALDYGLTSYPPELMGKSGSVAAMSEHGLRVISCGSLGWEATDQNGDCRFSPKSVQPWTVAQTARSFLGQLETAKS